MRISVVTHFREININSLIFIFAVEVSFSSAARNSNAFSQSVLFRVHEAVNIVSDLVVILLLAALVKEFPSKTELCDVWLISK